MKKRRNFLKNVYTREPLLTIVQFRVWNKQIYLRYKKERMREGIGEKICENKRSNVAGLSPDFGPFSIGRVWTWG